MLGTPGYGLALLDPVKIALGLQPMESAASWIATS
jgi:hypothetical protein